MSSPLHHLLLVPAFLAGVVGRQDPPPGQALAQTSTGQDQERGDAQATGVEAAPADAS